MNVNKNGNNNAGGGANANDHANKNAHENSHDVTFELAKVCDGIIAMDVAFDDVAETIEDLAYFEYGHGGLDKVVAQLSRLAEFFEGLRNKNEEVCRDLAQTYLLIGQLCQFAGLFDRSIEWLNKSVVVDDMYSAPYHALAVSFMNIGDESMAVKCLEQEIKVEPGNYYSYLLLARLYEKNKMFDNFKNILDRLLARDPLNISALHRLIQFYEQGENRDNVDVGLLRHKLLSRVDNLNRIEAVIRSYHLAHTGMLDEASLFLEEWSLSRPDVSIVHLAGAYIYGMAHKYSKKRRELALFKSKNRGRDNLMQTKIDEFALVFGDKAAEDLRRSLRVGYVYV